MEFMNSRTIFSALSKLREIQEIISLIFHEHSHLRLKENKKLSSAKSSPFFKRLWWNYWQRWWKRSLLVFFRGSPLKQTSAFIKMSKRNNGKLKWGRKMFPEHDFRGMLHFTEKSVMRVGYEPNSFCRLIISHPAEIRTHKATSLPHLRKVHSQLRSHNQPYLWHLLEEDLFSSLVFGWKTFSCLISTPFF